MRAPAIERLIQLVSQGEGPARSLNASHQPLDIGRSSTPKPTGSLPMRWALQREVEADAVVVYTGSETWADPMQPVEALRAYRRKTGIAAKLVVGLVSNGFTIADPTDADMLDVVGFDTTAPGVIAGFVRG